jgi:peptidoglycan hydrolase-like protein with peptidoglycan-binding domain
VRADRGEEMFLAGKVALSGIVFILLATGISGPRPPPLTSRAKFSKEVPEGVHRNDVEKIQQTLRSKGHYRGKVDGVFGLRTAASIRAYQKAENLPITGQIDIRTADRLGVKPEGREETSYETSKGKPSAYIKKAEGSRRTTKILQTENDNPPQ